MSEIHRNENDKTIADVIYINEELPDIGELSDVKSINTLSINNIKDSSKLQEFLLSIPISTIRHLTIEAFNMQDIDLTMFEQLQSLERIYIQGNIGISYNELLKRIPNKGQIKNIYFWNDKESENELDVTLLEEFKGLEVIGLRNISRLDMETLQSVLCGARNLEQFMFEGDIPNLDFISGIDIENINFMDENFDVGLITPKIARAHKQICFCTAKGKGCTRSIEEGKEYELQLPLQHIMSKEGVKELIAGAKNVELYEEMKINNENDLQRLIENKELLSTIQRISIRLPHIGVITSTQLKELQKHVEIKNIVVMDTEYSNNAEEYSYSIEQYEAVYNKVQEIIGDIPEDLTDLQKFMIIYRRLGTKIIYDHYLVSEEEKQKKQAKFDSKYVEENEWTGRNLFNGLIKGKCVCAGYADILYNCLNAVGIEACKVASATHAWNKVKLDGVWYNADLTWDCNTIFRKNFMGVKYCLRSDKKFEKGHLQEEGRKIECNKDCPRKEVKEAMRFAENFDRGILDAEYEELEEPSFVDRLKERGMILFGKRKMIAAESQEVTIEKDRRQRWQEISGITLGDSGQSEQKTEEEKSDNPIIIETGRVPGGD